MWLLPITFPGIMFILFYLSMKHDFYEMDPPGSPGLFIGLYTHYYKTFLFISVVGLLCAIGIAGFVPIATTFLPAECLLAAAIYGFLFNGLLVYFYESYVHVRYAIGGGSNYSKARYALIQSLAACSVTLFIIGLVTGFMEI
jgi:hypothetical protein